MWMIRLLQQPFNAASLGRSALIALVCGSLILLFSLGIRHGFGLFLKPITVDQGWTRESFAFAIALQNLLWGISQPFVGVLSDKYGSPRIVLAGTLLYAAGLWLMASSADEMSFIIGAGVLIGLGLAGTTFPVILATISRMVPPQYQSISMGIATSVGSFGQFIMLPVSLGLLSWLDWQGALIALSMLALLMAPLAYGLSYGLNYGLGSEMKSGASSATTAPPSGEAPPPAEISSLKAVKEALAARDFWLLSFGFFACGFQVVFIAVHLPAFLADEGLEPHVATTVLALIGLLNVFGTYYAGVWGGRYRKPMLLSWVYLLRGLLIAGFILLPITNYSAYAFGILMGLFWLSTVPLTSGTVAAVWGVKHMSMLGGIVFFWHQLGSFIGGWLGGYLYDTTGSYDIVWLLAIGFSFLSAILNWPIKENLVQADTQKVTP